MPATRSPVAWRAGPMKEIRARDSDTVEYELNAPFSELLPARAARQAVNALTLAHIDANVRRRAAARAWLDGDVSAALRAQGAELVPAPPPA